MAIGYRLDDIIFTKWNDDDDDDDDEVDGEDDDDDDGDDDDLNIVMTDNQEKRWNPIWKQQHNFFTHLSMSGSAPGGEARISCAVYRGGS